MTNGATGRVVLVTGGGKGLGRAFALDLAARGANLVINNRNRTVDSDGRGPADHVVAEILAAGGEAIADHSDVTDPGSGQRMVNAAIDRYGRLDAIVASAGVSHPAMLHRSSVEDVQAVLDINLTGALRTVLAGLEVFRRQGQGRVVLVSSVGGLYGEVGLGAYSASKGALTALGRTLALEGPRYGVHTNVLLPYATTQMTEGDMPSDLASRMDPALVAPVVSALLDPACTLNGRVLVAGGGGLRVADIVEGTTVPIPEGSLDGQGLADLVARSNASLPTRHTTSSDAFQGLLADLDALDDLADLVGPGGPTAGR